MLAVLQQNLIEVRKFSEFGEAKEKIHVLRIGIVITIAANFLQRVPANHSARMHDSNSTGEHFCIYAVMRKMIDHFEDRKTFVINQQCPGTYRHAIGVGV
jgi:hypothetical protein